MSVRLKQRWRSAAIGAVFLAAGPLAQTADLLTPAVNNALAEQWKGTNAEAAIAALQAYGSAKNVRGALPILKAGRNPNTKVLYETAASTLGDDFWRRVATYNSGSPSCVDAEPLIAAQFATDLHSLALTSATYRDGGDLAALAVLLKGVPGPPGDMQDRTRNTYRGCFSINPKLLFNIVNETIGIHQ